MKTYVQKDLYDNDQSSFAPSSPSLGAILMTISRRRDTQAMVYSSNGIVLSNKREQYPGTTTWMKFRNVMENGKSQI